MTTGTSSPSGITLVRRGLLAEPVLLSRVALWSLVEAVPTLLSGMLVAAAINRFLAHRIGPGVTALLLLLACAAVGALATRRLFPLLASLVEPVCGSLMTAVVAGALHRATHGGEVSEGSGVARLTGQVQATRNLLFGLLRSVREIAFTLVAAMVGLAFLTPAVAVLTVALVLAAVGILAVLLPGLVERHRAVLSAGEEVAQRTATVVTGLRDAIASGAEEETVAHVRRSLNGELAVTRALARATAMRNLVIFIGGQLPLVALLAAAPWLLRHGRLTVAEAIGAATYLTASLEPALRSLVAVAGGWGLDLVVHLQRLGAGFAAQRQDGPNGLPVPDGHELQVRELTFAYGAHADAVVNRLSFTVPEHGHLAIVGASGIGKSTLANLIAGLLAPDSGSVLLGGADVTTIDAGQLRRDLALIPQEAYVFAGSLRDNLTYLAATATERSIYEAADAVGLRALVDRLGGLDQPLGAGGVELSQGEKQLVALTRVYLSPARVVILDEATSSLDPKAEARAERAFARRAGSLVVIAHRISSAQRAQHVLLLEGDSAHLGTHDSLVRSCAGYASLVGHWDGGTADSPSDALSATVPVR